MRHPCETLAPPRTHRRRGCRGVPLRHLPAQPGAIRDYVAPRGPPTGRRGVAEAAPNALYGRDRRLPAVARLCSLAGAPWRRRYPRGHPHPAHRFHAWVVLARRPPPLACWGPPAPTPPADTDRWPRLRCSGRHSSSRLCAVGTAWAVALSPMPFPLPVTLPPGSGLCWDMPHATCAPAGGRCMPAAPGAFLAGSSPRAPSPPPLHVVPRLPSICSNNTRQPSIFWPIFAGSHHREGLPTIAGIAVQVRCLDENLVQRGPSPIPPFHERRPISFASPPDALPGPLSFPCVGGPLAPPPAGAWRPSGSRLRLRPAAWALRARGPRRPSHGTRSFPRPGHPSQITMLWM